MAWETHPWEGVLKEETFLNTRKPCHLRAFGEFWTIRGQNNWKGEGKKKKNKTQTAGLNCNSQQRNSSDPGFCQQRGGAGQGGASCKLLVSTGPECPEDNLKELTWDSNTNCGITRERRKREREREREKERENPSVKSSNLKHSLAGSQKKDWANNKGELADCRPAPPPAGGRQAGRKQPELKGEGWSRPQR